MTTAQIAALVVSLCGPASQRLADQIAPTIAWESVRTGIDARVIVAVMRSESRCLPGALGRAGEVGLMQIHPGATARRFCRDTKRRLWQPEANISCGVRVLLSAKRVCGGPPQRWLSHYNGRPCRASRYSRRVLRRLQWASK